MRPFFTLSNADLRQLVKEHTRDRTILTQVLEELEHRGSPGAVQLAHDVRRLRELLHHENEAAGQQRDSERHKVKQDSASIDTVAEEQKNLNFRALGSSGYQPGVDTHDLERDGGEGVVVQRATGSEPTEQIRETVSQVRTVPQDPTDSGDPIRDRVKQIFRFLKAFAEPRTPVRTLRDQRWSQFLQDLPDHPAIEIGEVRVEAQAAAGPVQDSEDGSPLIRIARPKLTEPPSPPQNIVEFLVPGWKDPGSRIEVHTRNVVRAGVTITERLNDDPIRASDFERWKGAWQAWADAERPAWAAMRIFEKFYELRGTMELESERVELVLGDGRLRWQRPDGPVDHPILLQRVELEFDASVPEFRIVDADRPPELYGAVLQGSDGISAEQVQRLRQELEEAGFHPLARNDTSGFLRRIVQTLGPRGAFTATRSDAPPTSHPVVARDPALFLRLRLSGFPAAFDSVLIDLESGTPLPPSLARLVGVEIASGQDGQRDETSPWCEPLDVLLSKPANPEQVQIARALEKHRAVLVQGPPGTGKSHTIANLIGHLVARGKRVLVTSHTTKALRVLRDHIVDQLKPLCVAVLDNDLEGRRQLEQSVREILNRLTQSTEQVLAGEVSEKAEARSQLNAEIERITQELRDAREAEYLPITVAGEAISPSDASRWVARNREENDWIPGPVEPGAPLPLSEDELEELYATNSRLTREEERELDQMLPEMEILPSPHEFAEWVKTLESTEPADQARFWIRPALENDIDVLERLNARVLRLVGELGRFEAWQRALVAEGHAGGAGPELWFELARLVTTAADRWEKSRRTLLEFDCDVSSHPSRDELRRTVAEIVEHLESGSSLSWWTLFTRPRWKEVLEGCRINGAVPSAASEFRALGTYLTLEEGRGKLARRWSRQSEPIGLPAFEQLADPPEPALREYTDQFSGLLDWWRANWADIEAIASEAGLKWQDLRRHEIARAAPAAPFEQDAAILSGPLQRTVTMRLAVAQRLRAERRLNELDRVLAAFSGPVCTGLRAAVRDHDAQAYDRSFTDLLQLAAKRAIWQRRESLLDRLSQAARAWAAAIRDRTDAHGGSTIPGDADKGWRWRQLKQEIDRRASLDEVELTRRLHQRREELRRATADLIDRRAWLGQKRRTNLPARQALEGWSQTQKRIGRGTGRRVPELQARARRLLTQARDAVPVWIMPLARVAESFDATQARFDVVIIDEASQSDVLGLLAWYLGDSVAVVGDNEQVSPLAVGERTDDAVRLIGEYLSGIPNNHLYDGRTSIYDLAGQCFGEAIRLREHFRCVPDIIEFSNALCYNGEIKPLRSSATAVRPHTVEYVVHHTPGIVREGKTNLEEARTVVALLKAMVELDMYRGKSVGAITLLGDEQARLIQHLAVPLVGAAQLEQRRFAAGNSAQFQGDERDVILLSMVDVPKENGPLRISRLDSTKQRYNVAASRAKDQLWLVHSLDPNRDLQVDDLRRLLIEHVRDPQARRREIERVQRRAESPFEEAVIRYLIEARYAVEPQVWIGGYRVDLVVGKGDGQAIIECDGDRFHGVDQIQSDMARQAVLERVGWRFVRIRGTKFFRDPQGTMEWVFDELRKLGVQPTGIETNVDSIDQEAAANRNRVVRRAWEIMKDQGWVAHAET